MTTLTPFHYRDGTTLLHSLDARFKIILLILFSLATLKTSILALASLTLLISFLMAFVRVHLFDLLKELHYFFMFLIIVFIIRFVATPGDPWFQLFQIVFTKQGMMDGLLVCWRLLLVVLMAFIFVSSTRTSAIKSAVERLLTPIPLIPEKRVATMMGLIVRFIPVIFQKAQGVSDAQKARCVTNRKNPIYRLQALSIPLMRGIFQDADKLAMAMTARCYDENQPIPPKNVRPIDWFTLIVGGLFCVLLFLL
jgi:energy-coupling factor transporter transmembrane protein EcfT